MLFSLFKSLTDFFLNKNTITEIFPNNVKDFNDNNNNNNNIKSIIDYSKNYTTNFTLIDSILSYQQQYITTKDDNDKLYR